MSSTGAKLAVIGFGAMGRALTVGLIEHGVFGAGDVVVTDVDAGKRAAAVDELGVREASSNTEAVTGAETIVIAVKPQDTGSALADIERAITPAQLIVSIAAGISIQTIESHLPVGTPVVRVMPNTPSLVGAGAAAFSLGTNGRPEHAEKVSRMLSAVGLALEVPEKLLDAVTGLSGSGPAYVYLMIETLADAGVSVGLPRATANALAAQTVLGAAKMVIETGQHPASLRDAVASPGGTTIAGLTALERSGFRAAIINAVQAATKRSQELTG
ncbi:MAG: pyrroline-5-carboxylate reductase [Armatimonadota bacterium]|nr:pyrroline-5-carboxylate reductase [Armatimonadota bacterium]